MLGILLCCHTTPHLSAAGNSQDLPCNFLLVWIHALKWEFGMKRGKNQAKKTECHLSVHCHKDFPAWRALPCKADSRFFGL